MGGLRFNWSRGGLAPQPPDYALEQKLERFFFFLLKIDNFYLNLKLRRKSKIIVKFFKSPKPKYTKAIGHVCMVISPCMYVNCFTQYVCSPCIYGYYFTLYVWLFHPVCMVISPCMYGYFTLYLWLFHPVCMVISPCIYDYFTLYVW